MPSNHTPVHAQGCRVDRGASSDSHGASLLVTAGSLKGGHVKTRSQGCWQACKDTEGCQYWFWCDHREGCVDHNGRDIPYKGCELRRWDVIEALGEAPSQWKLSSFAMGYMEPIVPEEQLGWYTLNKVGHKILAKPRQNLVITTSLWPKPCAKPSGDHINMVSILNKIDYARIHGYEFHVYVRPIDKSLTKLYSKVGLLRKLLDYTPRERTEWIMWIDADTIIMDMSFQIPYHLYHNKTFIAWGLEDGILAGDPNTGMNTGTMLIRNDKDVSERFWTDVAHVSRINQQLEIGSPDTPEGRIKTELEDQVQLSGSFEDLCDQNVIVYLLRVKAKDYMAQTLLESTRYCMSCWYKDVPEYQSHTPFVNHYAACQMCTAVNPMKVSDGQESKAWSDACHRSFIDNHAYTNHTLAVLLGCESELREWGPPLGQPLNQMYLCADKLGMPGCPPLPPLPGARSPYVANT